METAVIASYPDKNIQILFRSELQTGFLGILKNGKVDLINPNTVLIFSVGVKKLVSAF